MHFPEDLWMNDKNGDIIFMSLTGGETGNRNFELNIDFGLWNRQAKWGYFFDSSTAFRLPDTSVMSPDVAGVGRERWESLAPRQRRQFVPLCLEFVLELKLPSDRLTDNKSKMDDWMNNGGSLGWINDPDTQTDYIYRARQDMEEIHGLTSLSGESVLPNFTLTLG
jgi:Uma2 family endonuclease